MKKLMIAAALLAAACTPPAEEAPAPAATELQPPALPMADAAGNRMEALTEQNGRFCSSDGAWCITRTAAAVNITHAGADTQLLTYDGATGTPQIWPVIVRNGRNDESLLLGLTWRTSEMHSGGGAEHDRVTLYRFAPGALGATEALTFPSQSEISIRACFDEDDMQARREACLDQYNFTGQLSLDTENASGPARLILQTAATTYPGPRSRMSDSTQDAPLQESDLVVTPDAECSYRRVLTFNGEGYDYDTAPPNCEDYRVQ